MVNVGGRGEDGNMMMIRTHLVLAYNVIGVLTMVGHDDNDKLVAPVEPDTILSGVQLPPLNITER